MKIPEHTDAVRFMEIVNACRGTVELTSPEGDCINLKSTLSQYLSIASIFSHGYVRELELNVHDRDDYDRIKSFLYPDK